MSDETFTPDWFSRPADSIHAVMERRGLSAVHVAGFLEGGMATLRALAEGAARIDPEMAGALARAVGGSPDFWLRRQTNFDMAVGRAIAAVEGGEADEWLSTVEMPGSRLKARPSGEMRIREIGKRLVYYDVNSVQAWESRYGRVARETKFRTSKAFSSTPGALSLWLRRGELNAEMLATADWDPAALRASLGLIRRLTLLRRPSDFMPRLQEIGAAAGVAVVAVKAPGGCRVSGASRFLPNGRPIVLLSFRHRSEDQFWFTLFHEIGHLLLHGAGTFVDEDMEGGGREEDEANDFASRCIIPEERREEFEGLGADRREIMRFAVSAGISPGLIVGQMQHRGALGPAGMNWLKRRWRPEDIDPAFEPSP